MKAKSTLLIPAEVKALDSFLGTTEKEAPEKIKKPTNTETPAEAELNT